MKRSPMPRRRERMRQRTKHRQHSAERRRRADLDVAREVVRERSGGRCEAAITGVCIVRGAHAHHRWMRSQGGPDTPENLLWVCAPCHGQIHSEPARSYELGLLKHRWSA